ncbi:DUF4198 domain-containing protein [Sphingomonas sp. SRS2]|uniref:DUF4198 domain-containing protein n=1 Tax=Sphingomonas sp. SRS2 TaxID=133190 RepID=UPI0006184CA1|nr:DUF4198 domain-containing protein [Sphingomonas sp. SRS2]KKC25890.1 nickel uptake transporter family protein [Sphingomonas sp. SRS2]
MTRFQTRLLTAAALLALPVAASAHRQWMVPNATVFSGQNSWVTVDAASSNDLFFADHNAMRLDGVKVWAPDGTEGKIENASTGRYRSTFDVKLDKPGTWKIGTLNQSVSGTFKLNGEERRVGGRPGGGGPGMGGPGGQPGAGAPQRAPAVSVADIPAEATDVKLTQMIGRNEIYITANESSATVFKPTGKGIEFEPVTRPDELVVGEKASFRFLVDGKPAAGLKVTVVPGGKRYRNDDGARDFTTGADGVVGIDWPTPGMYWINTGLTDDKPSEPKATQRRMSYTTTVEVLLP